MTTTSIGPSFPSELKAAGLTDLPGVQWGEWGIDFGDQVSSNDGELIKNPLLDKQTRASLEMVVAAHNPDIPWPPIPTLDEWKAKQLQTINDGAQKAIDAVLSQYPEFERLTWATQADEAAAWVAAAPADRVASLVPWCAAAAAMRLSDDGSPMLLAEFMTRVIAKVQGFKSLSAQVAGRRQGYEDSIDTATTVEAVKAVVWDFTPSI